MSPAPRPLRLPRLLMACALALALVLAPSACTPGRTDAVVTTISAQRAEEESATASADCTNALETGSGTVALLSLSSTASRDSTLVVSRDADDRIQWAVLIDRPTACIRALSDYPGKPQDGAESILDNTMGNNPVSYAVLSPDGARLSLILLPEAVGDVAQQRTEVVVLDTATGGLVRRAEVTGLVLGQALTDDALAVQTARAPFPGGAGQGLISVFPLGDPTAPGSSFPSGQWLAGAGRTSLLLSPQSMSLGNQSPSGIPVTLTAVDVRGTEVARIAGVRELRPDRTVFVFASPADAARRPGQGGRSTHRRFVRHHRYRESSEHDRDRSPGDGAVGRAQCPPSGPPAFSPGSNSPRPDRCSWGLREAVCAPTSRPDRRRGNAWRPESRRRARLRL